MARIRQKGIEPLNFHSSFTMLSNQRAFLRLVDIKIPAVWMELGGTKSHVVPRSLWRKVGFVGSKPVQCRKQGWTLREELWGKGCRKRPPPPEQTSSAAPGVQGSIVQTLILRPTVQRNSCRKMQLHWSPVMVTATNKLFNKGGQWMGGTASQLCGQSWAGVPLQQLGWDGARDWTSLSSSAVLPGSPVMFFIPPSWRSPSAVLWGSIPGYTGLGISSCTQSQGSMWELQERAQVCVPPHEPRWRVCREMLLSGETLPAAQWWQGWCLRPWHLS